MYLRKKTRIIASFFTLFFGTLFAFEKVGSPQQVRLEGCEAQVDQMQGAAISGLREADDPTAGRRCSATQQMADLCKQGSALLVKDCQKVHYYFDQEPIDVVIPCIKEDLVTLNLCIDGIRRNGIDVRRIFVISPEKLTDKAEWFDEKNFPFTPFDVAMEIFGDEEQAKAFTVKGSRLGWIYQQLLKFYAPFVIPGISSNVLILDADSIFLNPISFRTQSGGGLYNPAEEHHPPYFEHMNRLIPGLKRVFPHYSGISHHMLFQRAVLVDLFSMIESIHQMDAWKGFCRCIDLQHVHLSSMSEYEIYFNFVFSRSDQVSVRLCKWANCAPIKKLGRLQKKGYTYATCHYWCR